ncbi:DUF2889 domain-containing protein [Novosphingobium sp. TH158]|uniref:DUF2889 domain-containing protein n=1 Tax=Novosphingobium sp. TH158 TaxID=2067455 RepID=UPI0013040DB3|nr:DUF2889 domain-containing protein [Novosphingobium sp. TH158]
MTLPVDQQPGFRRRFHVLPSQRSVTSRLEDDVHRMAVTLEHDGERVTAVTALTERAPWNICPGAVAKLEADWLGVPLERQERALDKKANCTHLFDLAELALRHVHDAGETLYEIYVSDPVDGVNELLLRRNGEDRQHWQAKDDVVSSPEAAAGLPLIGLRSWITTLSGDARAEARMLQWAGLVAHGRLIPWETEKTLRALPGSCFASQPERYDQCERVGDRVDFSTEGARAPLGDIG